MTTTRRSFMVTFAATSAAMMTNQSFAQTKLDEKNSQAVALASVHDSAKVDSKKYPKHTNSQRCGNCILWQSKTTDSWGNCPAFAGKQVNANGWCNVWAKKA